MRAEDTSTRKTLEPVGTALLHKFSSQHSAPFAELHAALGRQPFVMVPFKVIVEQRSVGGGQVMVCVQGLDSADEHM